jgi:hypothetical protein
MRSIPVYDMYPWDAPSRRPEAAAASRDAAPPAATQAVQVALDRRDNGGAQARQ